MNKLMILYFRKSRLNLIVMLLAIVASVPLALILKSDAMSAKEAVNLAMLYWTLAGIPLVALVLSGISGSEAASENTRGAEQILPVPQYKLLLSAIVVTLLEVATLILLACILMGFTLPLEKLTAVPKQVYHFYLFSIAFLTIYGFTISYAFRNGVAGAALAATAVASTVLPLGAISLFENVYSLQLIQLTGLKLTIAALVLGGALAALKLLSGVYGRRENRAVAKIGVTSLLLALPALTSLSGLAILNYKVRFLTTSFTDYKSFNSPINRKSRNFMIVQKPFFGEVFMIDADGNRATIHSGGESRDPGFMYLLPDLDFAWGETIADNSGKIWMLLDRKLLSGTMKNGFTQRAAIKRGWNNNLIEGKNPGIIAYRPDGNYYSPFPTGKEGLKWKKIPGKKSAVIDFLARQQAESETATFSADGKKLLYKNKHWVINNTIGKKFTVQGIKLKDGLNFIVPIKKGKHSYTTYICRPNGKVETLWPKYFKLGQNLYITPDGTIWGLGENFYLKKTFSLLGYKHQHFNNPSFYLLTADGKPLPEIKISSILKKTGVRNGRASLLRAKNGALWFNIGDKYMVKTSATNTSDFKLWRLPKTANRKGRRNSLYNEVSASSKGILIAALDGVYFMDWQGKLKKLE